MRIGDLVPLERLLGRPLGASWVTLGVLGCPLGVSWGSLGVPWGHLCLLVVSEGSWSCSAMAFKMCWGGHWRVQGRV